MPKTLNPSPSYHAELAMRGLAMPFEVITDESDGGPYYDIYAGRGNTSEYLATCDDREAAERVIAAFTSAALLVQMTAGRVVSSPTPSLSRASPMTPAQVVAIAGRAPASDMLAECVALRQATDELHTSSRHWPASSALRLVFAFIVARARAVQAAHGDHEAIRHLFRSLAGCSRAVQPGIINGLAVRHTPLTGNWLSDAEGYLAMIDNL